MGSPIRDAPLAGPGAGKSTGAFLWAGKGRVELELRPICL